MLNAGNELSGLFAINCAATFDQRAGYSVRSLGRWLLCSCMAVIISGCSSDGGTGMTVQQEDASSINTIALSGAIASNR